MEHYNMDIYVINLDERPDRLEHFDREMKKINWNYNRYSAKKNNCNLPIKTFSSGTDGCLASHFLLIQQVYMQNSGKSVCIFEDDAEISDDFKERYDYILNNFDIDDWDIFYLSSYYHLPSNAEKRHYESPYYRNSIMQTYHFTSSKYIHFAHVSFTTVAYIINKTSIGKIYNLLLKEMSYKNPLIPQHTRAIDHIYVNLQEERKINAFCITPGIVTQYENYSDLSKKNNNYTNYFKNACGEHIYSNLSCNFDYDTYFGFYKFKREIVKFQNLDIQYSIYINEKINNIFFNNTHDLNLTLLSNIINKLDKKYVVINLNDEYGIESILISKLGYEIFLFECRTENIDYLNKSKIENNVQNKLHIEKYILSDKKSDVVNLHDYFENICHDNKYYNERYCKCITLSKWIGLNNLNIKNIKLIKIKNPNTNIINGISKFLSEAEDLYIYIQQVDTIDMTHIINTFIDLKYKLIAQFKYNTELYKCSTIYIFNNSC